jgi:hypothetical protein
VLYANAYNIINPNPDILINKIAPAPTTTTTWPATENANKLKNNKINVFAKKKKY